MHIAPCKFPFNFFICYITKYVYICILLDLFCANRLSIRILVQPCLQSKDIKIINWSRFCFEKLFF